MTDLLNDILSYMHEIYHTYIIRFRQDKYQELGVNYDTLTTIIPMGIICDKTRHSRTVLSLYINKSGINLGHCI